VTRWTLVGASTEYTVAVDDSGSWLGLVAWGPHGVNEGPSPLAFHGPPQYMTRGDVAAVEYATDGTRPFLGADLVVIAADGTRSVSWQFARATDENGLLRAIFVDEVTGLEVGQCYRYAPGTDVIERWTEVHNGGTDRLSLGLLGSAAFTVPTPHGARLSYLSGQWSQEFTPQTVEQNRGRFEIGSDQGVTGHQFSPYLAVNDQCDLGATGSPPTRTRPG